MGDKIDKKINSLFSRRDNLETELRSTYSIIDDLVQRKKRRSTIEQALTKAQTILESAFKINDELKNLTKHTDNPDASDDDLVQWADVTLKNHEQVTGDARAFIDTRSDGESSVASMKSAVSTKIGKTSATGSSKVASLTESQRKKAQLAAKLRHQELERKSEAAVRLAKGKQKLQQEQQALDLEKQKREHELELEKQKPEHELELEKQKRELELQQEKDRLELEAIEEENRAKLAESKIDMLELQDDDESQVSIDDQVLGTGEVENGARGRVAAWLDHTAEQTVAPNGQEEETVQEAPPAATSGEPVPATEAPVLIAGPSGAPSASGAQPAVVVRTRQ